MRMFVAATLAAGLTAGLPAQKTTEIHPGRGGSPHVKSEWTIDGAVISIQYGRPLHSDAELLAAAAGVVERAEIAVALLPGVGTKRDLEAARDAGATVVRVSTVCTEADIGIQHLGLARQLGMVAHSHLNTAHLLDAPGVALFAILFCWQIPHFIAIAVAGQSDYARAGHKVLPLVWSDRTVKLHAAAWAALLVPVSLLLYPLGVAV